MEKKEKKWSQTTESTNKSSNAAKFKSKIIRCLPLLMETCQCIANALLYKQIQTHTKRCEQASEWVRNISTDYGFKSRGLKVCAHCVCVCPFLHSQNTHNWNIKSKRKSKWKTDDKNNFCTLRRLSCREKYASLCYEKIYLLKSLAPKYIHTQHTRRKQENETLTHPYLNHRCNLWHMELTKNWTQFYI